MVVLKTPHHSLLSFRQILWENFRTIGEIVTKVLGLDAGGKVPDVTFRYPLKYKDIVYVAWDENGTCLYVGQSSRGLGRPFTNPVLDDHSREVAELEIYRCANRNESINLEALLTKKYGPVYDGARGSLLAQAKAVHTRRNYPWRQT